jgi:hypothetical protein
MCDEKDFLIRSTTEEEGFYEVLGPPAEIEFPPDPDFHLKLCLLLFCGVNTFEGGKEETQDDTGDAFRPVPRQK